MTVAISVCSVSKDYGSHQILKNVSFSIESGQIIALLGENGAGKSTLINIILGLINRNSGSVEVLGKSVSKSKAMIGVMLQNDITLTRVKVKEIIHLYQSYYEYHMDYDELIQIAHLQKYENSFIKDLSGGQKRRLSFALALVGDPSVIFLDEPTNGMDPLSRRNFWLEVGKLKDQGKTIFITSHHLNELENIVDTFLVLKNHQLIFTGNLAKLRSLSSPTEVSFDSDLNEKIFKSLPEVISIANYNQHFILKTRNVNGLLNDLNFFLNDIQNLNIQQTSLEDIFLDMNKAGDQND